MNTLHTRIARLTVASAVALGLGALGAGSAFADGSSWAGSAPPESSVAAEDGAGTDQLCTVYSWANCIA